MKSLLLTTVITILQVSSQVPSTKVMMCGMTPDLRQKIIDAHNDLRNKIANGSETKHPGAVDVQAMTYNMTLENKASAWASSCPIGPNPNQTDASGSYTGENIYRQWDANKSISFNQILASNAVSFWYSEVKDYNSTNTKMFQYNPKTEHFSQLIWANSTSVGCGIALCNDTRYQFQLYPYSTIIVCNYFAAGNLGNQTVYTTNSTPGCKTSPNAVYPALCGNPDLKAPIYPATCGNPSLIAGSLWVQQKLKTWNKVNSAKFKSIIQYLGIQSSILNYRNRMIYSLILVFKKGSFTQLVINQIDGGSPKYQIFYIYSNSQFNWSSNTTILAIQDAALKAMLQ